ncbi:unnamed protein product [Cuscuta campestris]|uniref:F-box domain-containing protein n=1 Tax=Cuscuta campestris TaxID=132261 RepID=A0A484MA65_9ASTE|nr:unnamed protein product [Cuscuta campestris]
MENEKRRAFPESFGSPAPSSTMKLVEIDCGIPFLSEEIVFDILKRLPVKSLIRFRSVCSLWKNLINTPSFISEHLGHSRRQNPSLVFQRNLVGDSLNLYLLDRDLHLRDVHIGPSIDSFRSARIVGSSNGLLCVQIDLRGVFPPTILLWNPAIREVKQVPRSRTINDFRFDCVLGFAFSPIVNDYKIVTTYAETGDVVSGVEVYSLSTNSWKGVEFTALEAISFLSDCVCVNGSIFWVTVKRGLAFDGGDDAYFIVSFDLAMEEFKLIAPPPLSRNIGAKLAVYEDRLAILYYYCSNAVDSRHTFIDLWVICDEGIGGGCDASLSWSKKFTRGPYPCYLHPLTIWRNQIVCDVFAIQTCEDEPGEEEKRSDEMKAGMYLFNLASDDFVVFDSDRYGDNHDVFGYFECLVPLSNIHIKKL